MQYPGTGGRSGKFLMRWDVSLDSKTSKDGAHFMFLGMAFHSFGPQIKFAIMVALYTKIANCCNNRNLRFFQISSCQHNYIIELYSIGHIFHKTSKISHDFFNNIHYTIHLLLVR